MAINGNNNVERVGTERNKQTATKSTWRETVGTTINEVTPKMNQNEVHRQEVRQCNHPQVNVRDRTRSVTPGNAGVVQCGVGNVQANATRELKRRKREGRGERPVTVKVEVVAGAAGTEQESRPGVNVT